MTPMNLMNRPYNPEQLQNVIRLTWGCNTDTGQCGMVYIVSREEADALIAAKLAYENADHQDPDHIFGFAGDLHPMWENVTTGWELIKFVETYRLWKGAEKC